MSGHSHYYHRRSASTRSLNESLPSESPPPTPYPGISPYSQYLDAGASSVYPYTDTSASAPQAPGVDSAINTTALAPSSSGGGLSSLFGGGSGSSGSGSGGLLSGLGINNMSDLKGIIDRMGGIDGIMANIGKVQKIVQGVQQIAPMISLLTGALGKKKNAPAAAAHTDQNDHAFEYTTRRRRRKSGSKRTGSSRKTSGTARRKRRV